MLDDMQKRVLSYGVEYARGLVTFRTSKLPPDSNLNHPQPSPMQARPAKQLPSMWVLVSHTWPTYIAHTPAASSFTITTTKTRGPSSTIIHKLLSI